MAVLQVVGSVILGLATIFAVLILVRRRQRVNENLKRGLSMVLLRIGLPPSSEDIEGKSRDGRDVVEESLSRATALYSILASIAEKKGFKAAYYGQEHIGFEIIARGKSIQFYVVAPAKLVPIVRQAIISAYKSAQIEEVEEHNLFDPDVTPATIVGSQLALKEHYAYPIATYVESRQDIMKSLLGALSDLGDEKDGAGLQILLRPADEQWAKAAQEVAKSKGRGKDGQNSFFKELLLSPFKVPEGGSKTPKEPKEISSLDKKLIESIEKKVTAVGFETLIRVIVATPDLRTSRTAHNKLLSAFALLDAPKSNGFKPKTAKKIDNFITDFNLRIFPQSERKNILNAIELATIFHLPDEANIPTSKLARQLSKQVDGPRNCLQEGLVLGHNVFRDTRREIILGDEDRMRHMYVVGQTGTGKSVLLENLVFQDVEANKGFAFVDPHGDTAERVLARIPPERMDQVVYFHPGNMQHPMGMNIFESADKDQQDYLIQEAIAMLYKLYDPNHQGIMGPRYEHIFRNAAKLVMADPAGGTFIDIPKLFVDRQFVEQKLKHVTDQTLIDFWRKEIVDAAKSSEFGDLRNWFVAKFSAFLSNNMMRNIIGQSKSSFDLREIMDEGKMMIINLSLGQTGELNMKLLGMLFVIKFQMAAMSRADIPEEQRRDFTLYIDEFQNFATDSFANILSAARKYRLALVVANQHISQLAEEIRDSVLGNVGSAVSFRINAQDAETLVKQFYDPVFEIDDLTRLPLGHTAVRILVEGSPTPGFNMETLLPLKHDAAKRKAIEKQLQGKYGRPRAEVEKEITERLSVKSPMMPPGGPPPFRPLPPQMMPPDMGRRGPLPGPPPGPPGRPTAPDSFVDQWLRARQDLKDALKAKQKALQDNLDGQRAEHDKPPAREQAKISPEKPSKKPKSPSRNPATEDKAKTESTTSKSEL